MELFLEDEWQYSMGSSGLQRRIKTKCVKMYFGHKLIFFIFAARF